LEKILVTGANGYLGACVVEELKKKYSIEKLKERLEYIKRESLNFDMVIHCAGALRYRKGQHQSANADGTRRLLKGFKSRTKVVYISSKSVYGIGLEGDFTESVAPRPSDDYGKSKYEGELAIIESGFPYIILRSSTLFGLGVNNLGPSFPSSAMKRLANGENITLFSPDVFHEYLYVRDLASVVSKLLKNSNSWNNIFNISGPKRSLHQLISKIINNLKDRKIDTGIVHKVDQSEQKLFYLNSSKLLSLLANNIYTSDKQIVDQMGDFILS